MAHIEVNPIPGGPDLPSGNNKTPLKMNKKDVKPQAFSLDRLIDEIAIYMPPTVSDHPAQVCLETQKMMERIAHGLQNIELHEYPISVRAYAGDHPPVIVIEKACH